MNLELTIEQVNQILLALGHQPYAQVHELITEIQKQARQQLGNEASAPNDPE